MIEVARLAAEIRLDRSILSDTVFHGGGDAGGMLAKLSKVLHGHDGYVMAEGYPYEFWVEPSDGQEVFADSDAFSPSPEKAAELRNNVEDSAWRPTIFESIRLLVGSVSDRLGWLSFGYGGGPGEVICMPPAPITPEGDDLPLPLQSVRDWMWKWLEKQYWESPDGVGLAMEYFPDSLQKSPEDLSVQLVEGLRDEFLDRVVWLAELLQSGVGSVES